MPRILEKRRNLHQKAALTTELQSQIAQLQALSNLGTATAMIAHEVNNILTPLGNYSELALAHPDDKALTAKALQKTVQNSRRAAKILESIISMVNGEHAQKQTIPLAFCVDEIFTSLCRDFKKDRIAVVLNIAPEITVWAVPVQFQQVLMNLILNARDAMLSRGGTLTISASQSSSESIVEISDTGCGIDSANLLKIFEPFFTTKSRNCSNSGAGLGLAFCRQVIDAHGGRISVSSQLNAGTTFKLVLPNS